MVKVDRRDHLFMGLAVGVTLLGACSRSPKLVTPPAPIVKPAPSRSVVPERRLQLALSAAASINHDDRGRSTPLLVRVYLLSAGAAFMSANFMALFESDQSLLADSVLWRHQFQIIPGGSDSISRELPENARVLAIFAAFRQSDRSLWRAVLPLPAPPAPTTTPPAEPISVSARASIEAQAVNLSLL